MKTLMTYTITILSLFGIYTLTDHIVKLPECDFNKWSWLLNGLSAGAFAVLFTWLITVLREKPKIDVFVDNNEYEYYKWNGSDKYDAKYRIVLWTTITNSSILTNSLIGFELRFSKHDSAFSYMHIKAAEEYKFTIDNEKWPLDIKVIGKYQISPIKTLTPYESVEGYIFFPTDIDLSKYQKATFIIKTSRNTIKTKLKGKFYNGKPNSPKEETV